MGSIEVSNAMTNRNKPAIQAASREPEKPKIRHAGIRPGEVMTPVSQIRTSPENDQLYKPIDPKDPEIKTLAKSIKRNGILEPLVLSVDIYTLSGNRRLAAAKLAGLSHVPCIIRADVSYASDRDKFVQLLREYNRQRVKSLDEQVREEVISANPEEAYQSLIEHRKQQADKGGSAWTLSPSAR